MKKLCAIFVTSSVLLLSGCANQHSGGLSAEQIFTKRNMGGLIGAAGGAWAGSNIGKGKGNTAAIAIGTLLGAAIGSEVGASLDRADKAYMGHTTQQSLERNPVGQSSSWRNPDSGHGGSVTPTRTFKQAGRHCREYTQNIQVGGQTHQGYGTACRNPDGTWEII